MAKTELSLQLPNYRVMNPFNKTTYGCQILKLNNGYATSIACGQELAPKRTVFKMTLFLLAFSKEKKDLEILECKTFLQGCVEENRL